MIDSWLELSLETTPELAEAISDALHDHVDGGVVMEQLNDPQRSFDRWEDEHATGPVIVRGYLPNDDTLEDRKERVAFALRCMNMVMSDQHMPLVPMPNYKIVQREDWAETWKENFKPLRIGSRVLICPSWVDPATLERRADDILLLLDPGQAFGTGLHPTTQLCAGALETTMPQLMAIVAADPVRVLDVGSGTSILSIIAAKLGAAEVLGVDIEEEAVAAGTANARTNGVSGVVTSELGSWDAPGVRGPYHVVVANILAPVIIKLLGQGMARVGHAFIFSGILDSQAADVVAAIEKVGLIHTGTTQMLDWVCIQAVQA